MVASQVPQVTLVDVSGNSVYASQATQGGTIPGVPVASSAWHVSNNPAVNTVSTASKAAPGANKRLVVTWATFSLAADSAAPAAISTYAYILGSTGGQLWQSRIALPAVAGELSIVRFEGILIVGANESASAGLLVAGGANTYETASFGGYVVDVS